MYRLTTETTPGAYFNTKYNGAPPLTQIATPTDGQTLGPIFDIIGTAPAGETVELWLSHKGGVDHPAGGTENPATVVAEADNSFWFVGDSAFAVGESEIFVRAGNKQSPRVRIMVHPEPATV